MRSGKFRLLLFAWLIAAPPAEAAPGVVASGNAAIVFERNQGQADPLVKFVARGRGYSALFLTSSDMVLHLSKPEEARAAVVRMHLLGANPRPDVSGLEELPGKVNYFIGDDPARWRTNVPTYARVKYRAVYPGVDLVYYGNQRQLEYDFVVAPGADPRAIRLAFDGPDQLTVDGAGNLVLRTGGGEIQLLKPVVYQEVDGTRRPVAASYILRTGSQVGFQVAAYDATRPLVIDPVLVYATYLGGGKSDRAFGLALDASNNAYLTGDTISLDFPKSPTAYQGGLSKNTTTDCFITKLNPAASGAAQLVYSTYLGGSGNDQCFGVAIDGAGNAYVTGQTFSSNFPAKALSTSNRGTSDAFVVKLNPTGSALVYSVFMGGSADDAGFGIAVAPNAGGQIEAYVTGKTTSTNFPVTANGFQKVTGDPAKTALGDAFVAKLNAAGSALLYSSYLGGSGVDQGLGIAVDGSGNAYVTGGTSSINFPATSGAPSGSSAFVAKMNTLASGSASLVYSTYLGGSCADQGQAITVDASGFAYVTGQTFSTNFPGAATLGFQPTLGEAGSCGASGDAFVAKLDAAGSGLLYSTYLGGSGADQGLGIAVDGSGNAYVTGQTSSADLPTTSGALHLAYRGGATDAFVAKVNTQTTGPPSLAYLTYLGGGGGDQARAIAVDPAGRLYVAGQTSSSDIFSTGSLMTGFQPALVGGTDAFLAILDIIAPPVPIITSGPANPTSATSATFSFTDVDPAVSFLCQVDGGGFTACTSPQFYPGPIADGSHTFYVKAMDAAGNQSAPASFIWTVDTTPPPSPTITSGPASATNATGATFAFFDSEAGVTLLCQLDGAGFTPCVSGQTYSGLTEGSHTFDVVAQDAVGNVSDVTSYAWIIDATAPTSILTFPASGFYNASGWNNGCGTATGDICGTASDSGSGVQKVEVSVKRNDTGKFWNGAAFASNTEVFLVAAGTNSWSLTFDAANFPADGSYTVHVRATDNTANAETSPTATFTIDTTPPVLGSVSNLMFQSSGAAAESYPSPTATDNITLSPTVSCAPPSGSTFPLGDTDVTCTATDQAGNSSTITFTVTLQTDPVPTLALGVSSVTAAQGEPIILTATINVSLSTTTITPDCVNTTWTIRRPDGSTVEPRFRERMYGIPNDLSTIGGGVPFIVQCDVSEVIDPSLLPPGQYKFFATYSNYIQDLDPTPPVFTVWTGSINSPQADLTISESSTIRVAVDVKPNGFPNAWNCGGAQGLPVAVLSGEVFDPTTNSRYLFDPRTIDPASVRFGRTGGATESSDPTPSTSDLNGDGIPDLLFHFPFGATGFTCGDIPSDQQDATVVGVLKGQSSSGAISGSDSIRLVTGANEK